MPCDRIWQNAYNAGMQLALKRHPDRPCAAVSDITVEVAYPRADLIMLTYVAVGTISDLRLTAPSPSFRDDGLWRQTCFEAFIGTVEERTYYEFNFSPSTRWASYRFADYRQEMTIADETDMPAIEVETRADRYTLQAVFSLDRLSAFLRAAQWHLGLSAVIVEKNRRMSYWALAHPPGAPDFHHRVGFTHALPPRSLEPPIMVGI